MPSSRSEVLLKLPTTDSIHDAIWRQDGVAADVLDRIGAAVIVADTTGRIVHWNHQAERVYGWSKAEAIGGNVIELSVATHDVPAAREVIARLASGASWEGEFPMRRKDGSTILAYMVDSPLFDDRGELVGVVVVSLDVTARHLAEAERAVILGREKAVRMEAEEARATAERVADRIARLQLVTASLSEATTPERVTSVLVRQGIAALGAASGVVALLTGNGSSMEVVASAGPLSDGVRLSERLPLTADHPLAHAVRNGEPVWIGSRSAIESCYPGLSTAGTGALAAVPLMANGRVLGGLGLGWEDRRAFGADEQSFTLTLAQYCAQALDRSRLLEREQAAQRRLAFLAEASEVLASSLDYQTSLEKVAALAVPGVADWCTIHLLEEGGSAVTAAVAAADPENAITLRRIDERYPVDLAIGNGRIEVHAEIDEQWIYGRAHDPEHAALLTSLQMRSVVVVPLVARGKVLGAITLGMVNRRDRVVSRRWELADLGLAEDLARRAATAIDIARLYDERSQVARKLQETLLPPSLPDIPGVDLGVRYRATGEGAEVGGDFYDVFATPDGGWAAVIGDVCGKGADAAGVTGLARHTIRAVAMQERSPAAILARLNEVMLGNGDRFCTVCYVRVELDPASGGAKLSLASAGHALPLVVRSDGTVAPVGSPGTPVGLFQDPGITDATVELGAGDAVVLYTDGVTERRRGALMFGEEGLHRLLASLPAGTGAAGIAGRVEQEVAAFEAGPLRDDMAVLVVRLNGGSEP